MRCTAKKDSSRNRSVALSNNPENRQRRETIHLASNLLIIIFILLSCTPPSSGRTLNIQGVQIELGDNNRICVSFEGKITGIIVNGSINLPGKTFDNITRIGDTPISRTHSGMLTRIGRVGIHRDWHGNIIKIGNADILRDKHGSIIAVNGDPSVSPLIAIDPP